MHRNHLDQLRYALLWNIAQHRVVITDVSGQPIDPIFSVPEIDPLGTNRSVVPKRRY